MMRRPPVASSARWLALAAVAALLLFGSTGGGGEPDANPAATTSQPTFRIKAASTKLSPGVTRPVQVLLMNPGPLPIQVTSIEVDQITPDPLRPGCTATSLRVARGVRE